MRILLLLLVVSAVVWACDDDDASLEVIQSANSAEDDCDDATAVRSIGQKAAGLATCQDASNGADAFSAQLADDCETWNVFQGTGCTGTRVAELDKGDCKTVGSTRFHYKDDLATLIDPWLWFLIGLGLLLCLYCSCALLACLLLGRRPKYPDYNGGGGYGGPGLNGGLPPPPGPPLPPYGSPLGPGTPPGLNPVPYF